MGKHTVALARTGSVQSSAAQPRVVPSRASRASQVTRSIGDTGDRSRVGSRIRSLRILPALAFLACSALVMVPMIDPSKAFALAQQSDDDQVVFVDTDTQSVGVTGGSDADISRATFTITRIQLETAVKTAVTVAPPTVRPDPGSAKAIAYDMIKAHHWGDDQYSCLVALWNRESGWRTNAGNQSSGAYGIPQALPGSKMASAGPNWQSDPTTQIRWGLGYISSRYGTPCAAWASSEARGWY